MAKVNYKLPDRFKRCEKCNRYTDQIIRVPVLRDDIRMGVDPKDPKRMLYWLCFDEKGPISYRCSAHMITHKRLTSDGSWFNTKDTLKVVKNRLKLGKMRVVKKTKGGIWVAH